MTLRVDRSSISEVEATALDNACNVSQRRRERNAEQQRCINDNNRGTHGPATHGCRCLRCYLVHLFGAALVREQGIHALAQAHGIDINPTATTAQQGA